MGIKQAIKKIVMGPKASSQIMSIISDLMVWSSATTPLFTHRIIVLLIRLDLG